MEAADDCCRTPLLLAASESDACVAALLAAGARADVAAEGGETPLHRAAVSQSGAHISLAAIRALVVAAAAPLAARDSQGRTPAQAAEAVAGCQDAARLLRELMQQHGIDSAAPGEGC